MEETKATMAQDDDDQHNASTASSFSGSHGSYGKRSSRSCVYGHRRRSREPTPVQPIKVIINNTRVDDSSLSAFSATKSREGKIAATVSIDAEKSVAEKAPVAKSAPHTKGDEGSENSTPSTTASTAHHSEPSSPFPKETDNDLPLAVSNTQDASVAPPSSPTKQESAVVTPLQDEPPEPVETVSCVESNHVKFIDSAALESDPVATNHSKEDESDEKSSSPVVAVTTLPPDNKADTGKGDTGKTSELICNLSTDDEDSSEDSNPILRLETRKLRKAMRFLLKREAKVVRDLKVATSAVERLAAENQRLTEQMQQGESRKLEAGRVVHAFERMAERQRSLRADLDKERASLIQTKQENANLQQKLSEQQEKMETNGDPSPRVREAFLYLRSKQARAMEQLENEKAKVGKLRDLLEKQVQEHEREVSNLRQELQNNGSNTENCQHVQHGKVMLLQKENQKLKDRIETMEREHRDALAIARESVKKTTDWSAVLVAQLTELKRGLQDKDQGDSQAAARIEKLESSKEQWISLLKANELLREQNQRLQQSLILMEREHSEALDLAEQRVKNAAEKAKGIFEQFGEPKNRLEGETSEYGRVDKKEQLKTNQLRILVDYLKDSQQAQSKSLPPAVAEVIQSFDAK